MHNPPNNILSNSLPSNNATSKLFANKANTNQFDYQPQEPANISNNFSNKSNSTSSSSLLNQSLNNSQLNAFNNISLNYQANTDQVAQPASEHNSKPTTPVHNIAPVSEHTPNTTTTTTNNNNNENLFNQQSGRDFFTQPNTTTQQAQPNIFPDNSNVI